ncbi:Polyphosphatase [Nakaseomyces bracarensis]|uniref:Polyphosphatase n=1 Tax=Nakaseomyces bracarensis TaxID=273131 RepID=A0ABR4NTJ2_9SACH
MSKVLAFLQQLRVEIPKLIRESATSLYVVCGNESADFDSIACAISYAYFEHVKDPKRVFVPIINIPREDLTMRRDVTYALSKMDINEDVLFFREDLIQLKQDFGSIYAVIVDHNELPKPSKNFITDVVGILDHHADKKLYMNANPRVLTVTGSCSSLVTNYWSEQLDKTTYNEALKECAPLLISAGLLDTANLKYKVENPDVEAFKHYSSLDIPYFVQFDTVFKDLRAAKDNIDGLTVKQLIRKDYKEYDFKNKKNKLNIGVASIVEPVESLYKRFESKENFLEDCYSYQKEFELDCLIVLTSWNDKDVGRFRRELAIFPSADKFDDIKDVCTKSVNLKLEVLDEEKPKYVLYEQFDLSSSRKKVMPYMQDVYASI